MDEPRAYTADELRDNFLDYVRACADEWAMYPDKTAQERCRGVAFSILAAIDGTAEGIPAYAMLADPNPADKAYHIAEGENWVEPDTDITAGVYLHELWHK